MYRLYLGLIISILWSDRVFSVDLYFDTKPQAETNTCQSYSSILSLAMKRDERFQIDTFEELRELEKSFSRILRETEGSPYLHSKWPKAMEAITGGAYTFELKYETDIIRWMEYIAENTTQSNNIEEALSALQNNQRNTVLTSVTKLGESEYDGHIITVLGMAGTGLDSTTRLIAFNSAIKGTSGAVYTCNAGNEPGDEKYQAGVIETNSFSL